MSQVVDDLNIDTPNALSMQIMNGKNSNGSFLNYSLVIDNTEPHEVMEASGPNHVELGNCIVLYCIVFGSLLWKRPCRM